MTNDMDFLQRQTWPLVSAVADYWCSRAIFNQTTKMYVINGVVAPDEYTSDFDNGVNNSVYTNAVAKLNLDFAVKVARMLNVTPDAKWSTVRDALTILYDPKTDLHPEFEGYSGQTIKQADVVLLGYPLMFPMSASTRLRDLTYYSNKTDVNGPSMTWSMTAIGFLEVGDHQLADTYFLRSFSDNVRPPFNAWAETINGGCPHFITGAGGFLQGVFGGYGGVRLHSDRVDITPNLPSGTSFMKFRGFGYLGASLDISWDAKNTFFVLNRQGQADLFVTDVQTQKKTQLKLGVTVTLPNSQFSISE